MPDSLCYTEYMKTLTQKYLLNWLGTTTFKISDSDVIQSHQSLWGSSERPIPLRDISPIPGKVVTGDKAWDSFGWFLLGAGLVTVVIARLYLISEICFLLGVVCFLIRFGVRYTFIVFSSRESNSFLFSIRVLGKDKDAVNFVEELKSAISAKSAI